jgi:hypothetical protein
MRLLIALLLVVVPLGAHAKLPKACHQCAKQCSLQVPACVQADPDLATCSTKRCLKKAKHNCKKNLTKCCVQSCKSTGEVVCCGSASSPLPTTTTTEETSTTTSTSSSTTPSSTPSTTSTVTTPTSPGTTTTTLLPCKTSSDCPGAASCCLPGLGCCDVMQVEATSGKEPLGCAGPEYQLFRCCSVNGMPGPTVDPEICPDTGLVPCPSNTACPLQTWACGKCSDVDKEFAGYCQGTSTSTDLQCNFSAN